MKQPLGENMKLFIGNLPKAYTEDDLLALLAEYGKASNIKIIKDRETGMPRGFAFLEMETKEEATRAIEGLNGTEIEGRALTVSEAREQQRNPRGGGGGNGPHHHRRGGHRSY
jgi:cold-inducible RNA-binding protein